jgi:hypothetical protein
MSNSVGSEDDALDSLLLSFRHATFGHEHVAAL